MENTMTDTHNSGLLNGTPPQLSNSLNPAFATIPNASIQTLDSNNSSVLSSHEGSLSEPNSKNNSPYISNNNPYPSSSMNQPSHNFHISNSNPKPNFNIINKNQASSSNQNQRSDPINSNLPSANLSLTQNEQETSLDKTLHHSLDNSHLVNGQASPFNASRGSQIAQVSGSNPSVCQSSQVYRQSTPHTNTTNLPPQQTLAMKPQFGTSNLFPQSSYSTVTSSSGINSQISSINATQSTSSEIGRSKLASSVRSSTSGDASQVNQQQSASSSHQSTPTFTSRMPAYGTGVPNKPPEISSNQNTFHIMPTYSGSQFPQSSYMTSSGPLYSTRTSGGTVPTNVVSRISTTTSTTTNFMKMPTSASGPPVSGAMDQSAVYNKAHTIPGQTISGTFEFPQPGYISSPGFIQPPPVGSTGNAKPAGGLYSTQYGSPGVQQPSPGPLTKPPLSSAVQTSVSSYSSSPRGQPSSFMRPSQSRPSVYPPPVMNPGQTVQYPVSQTSASGLSNLQTPLVPPPAPAAAANVGKHPSTQVPQYINASPNSYSPMASRYPTVNNLQQGMGRMSVSQQGYNKLWGIDTIDLLQCRNILPPVKIEPPPIRLHQEFLESDNCSPDIFRCTLNKIPESNSLLQKSRLPLGILIHPFRDLSQLAVIQCSTIVRCRACRTYINPFVYFIDNKRWKCNLCFRANELPDEFQYDPVSKTYGDPTRRPEVKSSTIEFIAPSEYMLRPPQPAIYLFVLDVSRIACETGYLGTLSNVLLEELDNLPGDSRTQIGFILFDSYVHFFSIADNYNQAHEMIVTDIDDVFLPTPDSLLVNLNENRILIKDLLEELPRRYNESFDTNSALGSALQAAYKLMAPTGGRITVFQSCLPNIGPGSLNSREDPNQRSAKEVHHLGPQTDFYKRLSLDCSTQQISVDLFLINAQYADLATLCGISQFSGGCVYHFPLFRKQIPDANEKLVRSLRRYLTRKIGFEAVMRIRCSRGLSIHTFHGNFFVRSTDLLSLPNVNPDAGFGMQVSIEENLSELQCVCFQAALLYTSAKGERRIRVHTLCLPVTTSLSDVLTSADQQCIIGLLGKMAVDRSLKSSVSDAREAFINVAVDVLSAYKLVETAGGHSGLLAPNNLALIPLYILALLKSVAFRTGQSTRLDDRVFAMLQMKTLPLRELIQSIHCDLYNVTALDDKTEVEYDDKPVPQPPRLTLSSEQIDTRGSYILDTPDVTYFLIGKAISPTFLSDIFGVTDIRDINDKMSELPELKNENSKKLRHFISYLQSEKPWASVVQVLTDPKQWISYLITDRTESSLSYYEFLHHIKAQVK